MGSSAGLSGVQLEQLKPLKIENLEDQEEYKRIHGTVFNEPIHDIPKVVVVGRNESGSIVGFVSGFWLSHDSFYIQYSGIMPEFQGNGYSAQLSQILHENITYNLAIRNDNTAAFITTLKLGFIPIGVILKDNKLFVQLKRDKNG